ncbi:MAG: T9SS type A sorting domain-containing protein [Saprospiraceae bacterium]
MKSIFSILVIVLLQNIVFAQDYTSYFTGDVADAIVSPLGGTCMMGGATEHDDAMKWFLERSAGGDILVIRASGSDGYNDYLFSELGVSVNSVETIVFHNAQAAADDYVLEQIANAEAIWMAGGNQWNYVDYWRDNQVSQIINENIANKNMVIGGTSAGMAVLGGIYFTAQFGTITSTTALQNPYNNTFTISKDSFFNVPFLQNIITDTHYDDPDRKGRHVAFLARAVKDWGVNAKGIACDEYTSVCIDNDGKAYAFGDFPNYDENVYFLQVNCVSPNEPEFCEAGFDLNWVRNNQAVKVYRIKAETTGNKYFDLNNWEEGSGGVWENWYVENGIFNSNSGDPIDIVGCDLSFTKDILEEQIEFFPNPMTDNFLQIKNELHQIDRVEIFDTQGKKVFEKNKKQYIYNIDFSSFSKGVYFVKVLSNDYFLTKKIIH